MATWQMRQAPSPIPHRRVLGIDELDFLIKRMPAVRSGQVMGYLFRRFGYPIRGWDGYKELCTYLLTTPHKRLYLWARLTACSGGRG